MKDYRKGNINKERGSNLEKYIVEKKEEGERIDSYLTKNNENLSRVAIQRLIKEEKILVNNKKTKASYKVQENDNITLEEEKPKEIKLEAQDIPVEVLYEDDDIIVVNKPKGMVVHPGNRKPRQNISKQSNENM